MATKPIRVAVVGTGMAGLIVSYLLKQDVKARYEIHVFESGSDLSLDSASVSVKDNNGDITRVDIPMRALTSGYYPVLKSIYDHLGIEYQKQKLRFIFSTPLEKRDGSHSAVPYFIHASNNHEFPPARPDSQSTLEYLFELAFVGFWYIWFSIACFFVEPQTSSKTGLSESLQVYLARIHVPQRFTNLYLLPLISAVATCSHQELLQFPASDIVGYRRAILFGDHLVVSEGVQRVQEALTAGLTVRTSARVTEIRSAGSLVNIKVENSSSSIRKIEDLTFDRVVLAVPPDVAAKIYQPVRDQLEYIPTRSVTTIIERSTKQNHDDLRSAENINLCSSWHGEGWTQAGHHHGGGIIVTSNCGEVKVPERSLGTSSFTRTLRTTSSRATVNHMFRCQPDSDPKPQPSGWRNGDGGVWMTGAWCWDGMVLLEGAAVSAVRVAKAFDVHIPWDN